MDHTWTIRHSEVIDSRTICTAMNDLENEHMAQDGEGDWVAVPVEDWPADRRAEYREYARIIADIKGNSGREITADGDGVVLISAGFFTEYVKDECGDLHGNNLYAITRPYGQPELISQSDLSEYLPQLDHVDWQSYADSQRRFYVEIDIDGITYLYEVE